ncbi:hypothetical protein FOZ63_021627 [Perkinsus olseni]|uniref:Uncharacterized protein n=1 Tax=Perkinsus olseni TaxID=32597 RepID=A0A7J6SMM0_PEROL|nr:hypothetical protein FOZ63_021627 [Perkinsus olseni]KAF4733955.1 hypothetical protein FOZ62_002372 [Perkinsus olseni]
MVAYGLHTNALDVFIKAGPVAAPQEGFCALKAPMGRQFYFYAHSERGKPCLRVDLYYSRSQREFEIFSLYQDTEMTRVNKLAALDANGVKELTAPFEYPEFEINGQIHLHERGKSLSAAHLKKAKKFGLEWYDGDSYYVKNGKAIVLIHAVACGWPSYLKGYKFIQAH